MKSECIKAVTVRFYSERDNDLIKMAINQSGLLQSEWARQALILSAESQIMNGGPIGHILKNTLLTRRLIQKLGQFSTNEMTEAMNWSSSEFGKMFKIKTER